MYRKFNLKLLVFMIMLTSLAACVGMEPSVADKQLLLRQRCEGYIKARNNSDVGAMQQYYKNPGSARLGNIIYKSSEIIDLSVSEDGSQATAKLKNSIMAMGFTFDDAPQTLSWEWHNNNWFLVVKAPPANPFMNSKPKSKIKTKE